MNVPIQILIYCGHRQSCGEGLGKGEDRRGLEEVNGGKRRTYVMLSKIKIKRKKKVF